MTAVARLTPRQRDIVTALAGGAVLLYSVRSERWHVVDLMADQPVSMNTVFSLCKRRLIDFPSDDDNNELVLTVAGREAAAAEEE